MTGVHTSLGAQELCANSSSSRGVLRQARKLFGFKFQIKVQSFILF